MPCRPPRDLPHSGMEPRCLAYRWILYSEPPGKSKDSNLGVQIDIDLELDKDTDVDVDIGVDRLGGLP